MVLYRLSMNAVRSSATKDSQKPVVGEFEKPRYFDYKADQCAHARNKIEGCSNCIDICSTGAITARGDGVYVEPHLCMGCGACASSCPSGAMRYAYPSVPELGQRIKSMLSAYREAGGKNAAIVFHDQHELQVAFKEGKLDRDFVAVVRFQGPRANGMPELHRLTPALGVLQDRGHMVALLTDGRMSGASGKVPAAIHVTPEALDGGMIGRIENGDVIRLDAEAGTLEVKVGDGVLASRAPAAPDLSDNGFGMGRELFAGMRALALRADAGAGAFG